MNVIKLFRSNTDALSDWLLAIFGLSYTDNLSYFLTTDHLKADEVPDFMQDAKTSSEFVAGLLNAYYTGVNVVGMPEDKVCRIGSDDNDPNQTEIKF